MKKIIFAVVFFLSIIAAARGFCAETKFAYVDLSKIFAEYKKTKDYDKTLADKEQVYTAERDKMAGEIKQLQDKLDLLNDKEKDAKKPEFETKLKTLEEFDRQKQTDLRKEQDERMKEILKDIEETIKQHAQKEGYTMVFNDRVLVYQDKNLDISSKIIELLNKAQAKK